MDSRGKTLGPQHQDLKENILGLTFNSKRLITGHRVIFDAQDSPET